MQIQHHFPQKEMEYGCVPIFNIPTHLQMGHIMTKALERIPFIRVSNLIQMTEYPDLP